MSVRVRSRKFFEEAVPSTPAGVELPDDFSLYENVRPARESNLHSDVLVPLAQASITGVLVGASAAVLFLMFLSKSTDVAMYIFSAMFTIVTASMWIRLVYDRNRLLWSVERLSGRDIDGDGTVGEPARLRIEVSTTNEHGFQSLEIIDIPGNAEKFRQFACATLAGKPVSLSSWVGRNGLYTRNDFIKLRDALLNRGWLEWRNRDAPAQGVVLTRKGEAALRQICPDPPTPADGGVHP